jgi:hypothetical protein
MDKRKEREWKKDQVREVMGETEGEGNKKGKR